MTEQNSADTSEESEPVRGGVTVSLEAGRLAGAAAADAIEEAIARRGRARVIFASAPSQESMLHHLGERRDIDWSRVESFHMDEYLGLPMEHPRAFGQWLHDRLPSAALPGLHRIDSAAAPDAEIARYSAVVRAAPIDLTCLGVGMNGHVAFNEPGRVRFDDVDVARVVELDLLSRRQQVEEGLFATIADVPSRALSLTFTALAGAARLVCTVLGEHKAAAVADALEGPVTEDCPASGLQRIDGVQWFLDEESASRLSRPAEVTTR